MVMVVVMVIVTVIVIVIIMVTVIVIVIVIAITIVLRRPLPYYSPKSWFFLYMIYVNMEIIWLGNLEIWLRYDFNMPLAEDLFESGTLQGHSGRLAEAEWRAPNS